ncbi:aldo/keto reductase [Sphingobacterium sp.]|uniref:aldo/keto reductase n=1 Tax=Sphingobacterium sp. TaxID=341027 RepID=UPI0028AD9CDC|nr:aldo/keto reductase [Sphingobacterium sp.]
MEKSVQLAHSDLQIVPIIFGGNVFGWTLDEQQSFKIMDSFVDMGFDAIDTANNYSHWIPGNVGGESETIIGNWFKESKNRDKIVLMTKVGGRFGYDSQKNTKASYIKEQVELSLKRLQTDYIDLYQTHYDDTTTPVEETLRAYDDLIKEGKVRYIGASNISTDRLIESLDTSSKLSLPAYISLQPEYNLYDREKYEREYEATAKEYGLAVIPYYSLASGFLSGKYLTDDDFSKSARGEGIEKRYWNERGKRIVAALNEVASAYRTSASSVALAWLLAQPTITAPIASATKDTHLQSFVAALQLRLGDEAIEKLNDASRY